MPVLKEKQYRHNHYVPEWYQKRFLPTGQSKLWYLDLHPEAKSQNGHSWVRRDLLNWGPVNCFAEDDLYTVKWGSIENTDIEKFFFGSIDGNGKTAVEHFSNFQLNDQSNQAFENLLRFMSVQKLRTPKGLGYLRSIASTNDSNEILLLIQRIRDLYCAIWTECIWQIADASQSETKFILSDHPVVVYNRECFPDSKWCTGFNEPDIRYVATHTYFPLSLDKILILTNLSWVRDPYQNPMTWRPNPNLFRGAIFNFLDIQFDRHLNQEEVTEINYITKRRALRYVAAAKKEWLNPENALLDDHWRKLGDGYLFMPDPRHIHGGGEIIIGYEGGQSDAFSAYGHKPWQKGYKDPERDKRELEALHRFKAEWSRMFGPDYRGLSRHFHLGGKDPPKCVSAEFHKHELDYDKKYRDRVGERQRRRSLRKKAS